jgi:abhydrolase domain-containing protein 17
MTPSPCWWRRATPGLVENRHAVTLRSSRRSSPWRVLLLLVAVYALFVAMLPILVASMLYYPQLASGRAPAGTEMVPADGMDVAVFYLPNPDARYTLWLFHGNAEDLGDLEPFLITLRNAGFAVFAFDYPGYSRSTGRPTEQSLYAASRAARRHLREVLGVPAERTILYGRSLGSGPAVQMATEERNAGLILQSPFVSVFRVVTRWRILPFDQFVNLDKIDRINCPLLIMHGRADEVVPFRHGEALYAKAREPKQALWVPRARHNDFLAVAGPQFWQALRDFPTLIEKGGEDSPRE